jgi:phosphoglycolate phosphatase
VWSSSDSKPLPSKPVLTDLDGTVVDTAPAIFESLHVTCADMGIAIDRDLDLSFCLGPPLHWCLEQLGVPPDVMPDAIVAFERAHTERLHMCTPMPGVREVFEEVHGQRIPIGIVTIKPQGIADLVLAAAGLHGFVSVVMGRTNDLDPRTKTDLLREALDHPELQGPDPLYLGDHDNDAVASKDLDVPFLRYPDYSWAEIRETIFSR